MTVTNQTARAVANVRAVIEFLALDGRAERLLRDHDDWSSRGCCTACRSGEPCRLVAWARASLALREDRAPRAVRSRTAQTSPVARDERRPGDGAGKVVWRRGDALRAGTGAA